MKPFGLLAAWCLLVLLASGNAFAERRWSYESLQKLSQELLATSESIHRGETGKGVRAFHIDLRQAQDILKVAKGTSETQPGLFLLSNLIDTSPKAKDRDFNPEYLARMQIDRFAMWTGLMMKDRNASTIHVFHSFLNMQSSARFLFFSHRDTFLVPSLRTTRLHADDSAILVDKLTRFKNLANASREAMLDICVNGKDRASLECELLLAKNGPILTKVNNPNPAPYEGFAFYQHPKDDATYENYWNGQIVPATKGLTDADDQKYRNADEFNERWSKKVVATDADDPRKKLDDAQPVPGDPFSLTLPQEKDPMLKFIPAASPAATTGGSRPRPAATSGGYPKN